MRVFVLLILMGVTQLTFAQKNTPALERQVTLSVNNEPIHIVLEKISAQTGIKFSYNPTTVKVDRKVSFTVSRKSVRRVLSLLFDETIVVKPNGNYIILTYKAPKPVSKQEPTQTIQINGYVYSNQGGIIKAASIYNTDKLLATVSNEYGFYTISIPANQLPLTLKVSKEQYSDTIIRVDRQKTTNDIVLSSPPAVLAHPIFIEPTQELKKDTVTQTDTSSQATKDTVASQPVATFLQNLVLSDNLKTSIRNIKDTVFRTTQISLIPYISTNRLLSGNTVNDYSLNILIGYSQGVNKAEIGGLMNIDRGDVKYFQAAGLLNAVGGQLNGFQAAGIGNITKGKSMGAVVGGIMNIGTNLTGAQIAGIVNLNFSVPDTLRKSKFRQYLLDTIKGVQVAGITNINAGYTEGTRVAGILNSGNANQGVQVAGIVNSNLGKSSGVNIAGIVNYNHDSLIGSNIAGIININNRYIQGVQGSGLVNIALKDVKGMQLTSILNIAPRVSGTQLALFNFSDSAHGVPIGFLSYVHSGYHKLEVFGDDVIYTQLAFRTGVRAFHNIFNAGVDLTRKYDGLWNLGYGIGSNISLSNRWSLTFDLLAQQIIHKTEFENAPFLGNFFMGIERQFHSRFSVSIGPVYHALLNFAASGYYTDISKQLIPYSFSETTFDNGNTLNMWVGAKVSFKFL